MIWRCLCVMALLQALVLTAQENTDSRIYPEDVTAWVNAADLIVIGTFRVGLPLPWFDGWHYESQIEVRERLVPGGGDNAVALPWIRPYGVSCLVCDDLRPFDGQTGIWFLGRRNNNLRIVGGKQGWCSAPLNLTYINAVRDATKYKSQAKR